MDREVVADLVSEAGVDQSVVVVFPDPGGGLLVAEETEDESRFESELVHSAICS